jgi:TolB-like protein
VQATPVTLAVLPFANLSSDSEQEYFSDGLTEEILNQLAQIKALAVTGRTSSFAFKGRNEDLRVIGEKLGVAYLLEGSVRKAGDELRIKAQLNDARSGAHLWSHTYERLLDNVFDIQESIAKDVARALSVKLEVGELTGRPGMTRNVEAYDAFLASLGYTEPTAESLPAAIAHLERATALDPDFVAAWSSLANLYAFASSLELPGNTAAGWAAKSDAAIERIKGISDFGRVVHEVLAADRSLNRWAMVDAGKHLDAARALAEKLGLNGRQLEDPVFLLVTGQFTEAIVAVEQAKVTDPLNAFLAFALSKAYAATGNLPAAIAESERGLEIGGYAVPIAADLVTAALAMRDRTQIERRLVQVINADEASREFYSAMKVRLDKPAEALAVLHRRAAASTNNIELSTVAVWMAWFGDAQGALETYRDHADLFRAARRSALLFDIWGPVMRDMRKLPGFKDLVREAGLVDYWQAYGWGDLCKPLGADDFECQ